MPSNGGWSPSDVRLWHKCPLVAQSGHPPAALALSGVKRTVTNRCLPISIYMSTRPSKVLEALVISKRIASSSPNDEGRG
jgi:hypothetical protein